MRNVFVGSTWRDLISHREAVIKAVEGLDGYHCVAMERFGARDRDSEAFCRLKVRGCDLFVGIVGRLYGSCPPGSEDSHSLLEYEVARTSRKPRLMFLSGESTSPPEELLADESEDARRRQQAFRERVRHEVVCDTFTTPEDLARRVTQAISNWEHQQSRKMLVRRLSLWIALLVALALMITFVRPFHRPGVPTTTSVAAGLYLPDSLSLDRVDMDVPILDSSVTVGRRKEYLTLGGENLEMLRVYPKVASGAADRQWHWNADRTKIELPFEEKSVIELKYGKLGFFSITVELGPSGTKPIVTIRKITGSSHALYPIDRGGQAPTDTSAGGGRGSGKD